MPQSQEDRRSEGEIEAEGHQNSRERTGLIKLHVERDSFVFTQNSNALQLTFEDCEFKRLGKWTEWPPQWSGPVIEDRVLKSVFNSRSIGLDTYDPSRETKTFEIYGILGIIHGVRDRYLAVISAAQLRGYIEDSPIYAIDKVVCVDLDYYRAHHKLAIRAKNKQIEADNDNTDTESDEESSASDIPEVASDAVDPVAAAAASSADKLPVLPKPPGKGLLAHTRPTQQMIRSSSFINKMKQTFGSKVKSGSDTDNDLQNEAKYDGAVDTPAAEEPEITFQDLEDDARLDKRMVKEVQALFSGQTFFFSPTFGKHGSSTVHT
jgi:hypothetical protein